MTLKQKEADRLIAVEKHTKEAQRHELPPTGGNVSVPLVSVDRLDEFLLDVTRSSIRVSKITFQLRGRKVIPLVRLDLDGPPHRNPNDEEVPCPHLHVYREGFGLKWAIAAPADIFRNTADIWQTLKEFMAHCKITREPEISEALI